MKKYKNDDSEWFTIGNIGFSMKCYKFLLEYDEKSVAKLIATMRMSKWVGNDDLVRFDGKESAVNYEVEEADELILHEMTRQLCEYKMQVYVVQKGYKEE